MGTFHENIAEELKKGFPETPESFRRLVEQEVQAQIAPPHSKTGRKKFRPLKVLLPLAACLALAGGTVVASDLPAFGEWLSHLKANRETVAESIIHQQDAGMPIILGPAPSLEQEVSPEVSVSSQDAASGEPLFSITDAYYDGSTLIFWADPGEDSFDLGDHVYINGCDSRLEYVSETSQGSGVYECLVTVLDAQLHNASPEMIHVEVTVSLSGAPKVPYSFTLDSEKLGSTLRTSGSLETPYGEITSYTATLSPSRAFLSLDWTVTDPSMLQILQSGNYILEDAYGNRLERGDWLTSCSSSPGEDTAEGHTLFHQELDIRNFDASSPTMTLIPVSIGADEEGYFLYDTQEVLEDKAFTIDLAE